MCENYSSENREVFRRHVKECCYKFQDEEYNEVTKTYQLRIHVTCNEKTNEGSIGGEVTNAHPVIVSTRSKLYKETSMTLLEYNTNVKGVYISEKFTSSIRKLYFRYFVCGCCKKKINVSFYLTPFPLHFFIFSPFQGT